MAPSISSALPLFLLPYAACGFSAPHDAMSQPQMRRPLTAIRAVHGDGLSARRNFLNSSVIAGAAAAAFTAPLSAEAIMRLPILEELPLGDPSVDPRMIMTLKQMERIGWGGAYIEDGSVVLPNASDETETVTKVFEEKKAPANDIRLILYLMGTLDKVLVSLTPYPGTKYDERTIVKGAIEGFKSFSKSSGIFPRYAKDFVARRSGKTDKQIEADPLVVKVKQAVSLVSSCEALLKNKEKFKGMAAIEEAISRLKRAQRLLAEYCVESGAMAPDSKSYVTRHLAL